MPIYDTKVKFIFDGRPCGGGHATPIVVEADDEDAVPDALDKQLKHRAGLRFEIVSVELAKIQRPIPEED